MIRISIGILMFILSFLLLAMIPPPKHTITELDNQAILYQEKIGH